MVKELGLLLLLLVHLDIGMEEDEEAEAEGNDEEGIPEEDGEEGGEDAEEHGGVDVAPVVQSQHQNQPKGKRETMSTSAMLDVVQAC